MRKKNEEMKKKDENERKKIGGKWKGEKKEKRK